MTIAYTVLNSGTIQKFIDGTPSISFSQIKDNQDYQEYLKWIANGGIAIIAPIPVVTDAQKIEQEVSLNFTLFDFVDATFRKQNGDSTKYDSIYAEWKQIISKYPGK